MKRKKIIVSLILLLICSIFTSAIIFVSAEDTNKFVFSDEIEDTYLVNDSICFPTATFKGKQANCVLTLPNGAKVDGNEKVELTMGGYYSLNYNLEIDGENKSISKTFFVETPLASVKNKKSVVQYAEDSNNAISQYNTGRQGLFVSLAEGDTLKINDVFNFNETSMSNYAFRVAFLPNKKGSVDAQKMYIKFVDVYDVSNTVTILLKLTVSAHTYTMAKACDQPFVGYESAWTRADGTISEASFHIEDRYGAPVYGVGATGSKSPQDVGFYFQNESKQLWARCNTSTSAEGQLIDDFDDASFQTNPWNGFTTGDVRVEVWFETYNSDSANIQILEIGDCDLSRDLCLDTTPPRIEIDDLGIDTFVGYESYKFPIPEARAIDRVCGNLNVNTFVYYGYSRHDGIFNDFGTEYYSKLNVENGKFATDSVGEYAIVYRAEDYSGNKTEIVKTVNVLSKNLVNQVRNMQIGSKITSVEVGNIVDLPKVVSVEGGTGKLITEYVVTFNGKDIELKGDVNNGMFFVPVEEGNYAIKVISKDILDVNQVVEYTLKAKKQTSLGINEKVNLPKYFFADTKYSLPTPFATDISGNKKEIVKIEIIDGAGSRIYDNKFVSFTPDNNGNVVLNYYTGNNNKYSYIVPVVDIRKSNGKLDLKKYFRAQNQNDRVEATSSGIDLYTNVGGFFEFMNPEVASTFKLSAKFIEDANGFNSLTIELSDMYDVNNVVMITIKRDANKPSKIYVNGKLSNSVLDEDIFSNYSNFDIQYNNEKRTVKIKNTIVNIDKNITGQKFSGFTSGKLYFRIGLEDIFNTEKGAGFDINAINTQKINNKIEKDNSSPIINLLGKYEELKVNKGDKLEVYSAVAGYSIEPSVFLTTTLKKDGKIVADINGVKLENVSPLNSYFIDINEYGKYELVYTVSSDDGRGTTKSFTFIVLDEEPPTLQISGVVPGEVTVGEVKLPNATATDNISKKCTIFIAVFDPYGCAVQVKNNIFQAHFEGQYIVSYYAIDDEGNLVHRDFSVNARR